MNIEDKLQEIRKQYASELPVHISNIYQYWEQVLKNPDDLEALDKLMRICHNLSGTGASFGFTSLSQHTREIEHFLRPTTKSSSDLDSQKLLKISDLITRLNSDCKQA